MKKLIGKLISFLFSSFMVLILIFGLFVLLFVTGMLFLELDVSQNNNVSKTEISEYWELTEEHYNSDQWLDFHDIDVEVMQYGKIYAAESGSPIINHATRVYTTVDISENPTTKVSLDYEAWNSSLDILLKWKESAIKKQLEEKPVTVAFDYGAESAYWLGDVLILRYNEYLFCFNENTSRELLDSEKCASFMKMEYGNNN